MWLSGALSRFISIVRCFAVPDSWRHYSNTIGADDVAATLIDHHHDARLVFAAHVTSQLTTLSVEDAMPRLELPLRPYLRFRTVVALLGAYYNRLRNWRFLYGI